ncbi:MAG: NUDIX domain-containing protein [Candidatus Micrarchaeia archaeon]|jgi:8-oxo-dGTP pyrophosphatase MutT (NUDIX family)
MPRKISETTKFEGRIFKIKDILVRHDNGKEFSYEVMTAQGGSKGSMVAAVDEKGRVVLVEEYFAGINKPQLCLPKGRADEHEKPVDAARRELEEETGFRAKNLKLLCKCYLSPGYSDQLTYIYLATGLSKPAKPLQGDEVEPLKVVLLPLSKAVALAKSGKISEARAIAGLLLAQQVINGEKRQSKKTKRKARPKAKN